MSLLFYVDSQKGVILHPEVVKLCESFTALNEKEILYIILAYDYNSIYRQFPEHDRKRKAMWHAFNENETELIESGRILTAATDYISLQYNPKIEVARAYQKKIDRYLAEIESDDSPASVKKKMDVIKELRANVQELEREVDAATLKRGQVKGKMQLSYLEELMSNRKNYQAVIAAKKA